MLRHHRNSQAHRRDGRRVHLRRHGRVLALPYVHLPSSSHCLVLTLNSLSRRGPPTPLAWSREGRDPPRYCRRVQRYLGYDG